MSQNNTVNLTREHRKALANTSPQDVADIDNLLSLIHSTANGCRQFAKLLRDRFSGHLTASTKAELDALITTSEAELYMTQVAIADRRIIEQYKAEAEAEMKPTTQTPTQQPVRPQPAPLAKVQ